LASERRIVMSGFPLGPLVVAEKLYRADVEIVAFPARVEGADVEHVTFWLHRGDRSWMKLAKQIVAVDFPTPTTATIEWDNGDRIQVAYVPVEEADRKGHHMVVRTQGGTEHDLGVQTVNAGWHHTALIQFTVMRYSGWARDRDGRMFEQQFTDEIRALLTELADTDALPYYRSREVIDKCIDVSLYDDLSCCRVIVMSTLRGSRYALNREADRIIASRVEELIRGWGVDVVDVATRSSGLTILPHRYS
jgi:hypothetical protein